MNTCDNALCSSVDQLESCLKRDPHMIPTIQSAIKTFELPLDQDDIDWLGDQVDPFETDGNLAIQSKRQNLSVSSGLQMNGVQFTTDFLLMGVCLYMYVEQFQFGLDGNLFGPQQLVLDADGCLVSPDEARFSRQPAEVETASLLCPAQFDWGGPTLRGGLALMQAYRMVLECPSSPNVHELVNQRLTDMGNCCLHTDVSGFGTSLASEIYYIRRVNARLQQIQLNNKIPAPIDDKTFAPGHSPMYHQLISDLGFFLPINAEVDASGSEVSPLRMRETISSYGALKPSSSMHKWYKMPVPRVIPAHNNIKISLKRDYGGEAYYNRMLAEMMYMPCLNPVPGVSCDKFEISEDSYSGYGSCCVAKIPGGQLRLGIGLKGYQLTPNLCSTITNLFDNMTEATAESLCGPGGCMEASPEFASMLAQGRGMCGT